MKGLTKRQAGVLAFIRRYVEREHVAPSMREVGDALGVTVRAAHDHVRALERKGHLRRRGTSRAARNYALVADRPCSSCQGPRCTATVDPDNGVTWSMPAQGFGTDCPVLRQVLAVGAEQLAIAQRAGKETR